MFVMKVVEVYFQDTFEY